MRLSGSETVLAVDDDPILRDIYEIILGDLYNLHLASSGEEATDLVKQRIESFNNETVGWVYQINQSVYQRLTKPRDSWLDVSDGTS